MASNMFSLDHASTIARLVSQAFGKKSSSNKYQQDQPNGESMFGGFFRLLGLGGSKIGALAINTIIFLAQLVSI